MTVKSSRANSGSAIYDFIQRATLSYTNRAGLSNLHDFYNIVLFHI